MKKWIALALCLVTLIFAVSCQKQETPDDDGENDKPKTTTKAPETSVSFGVTYNGVKVDLGADAATVLASLGDPSSEESVGSCGGQGTLTKYLYPSVEIIVLTDSAGKTTVDSISLRDDGATTRNGVGVGSTKQEILDACGKGYKAANDNGITYESGKYLLEFTLKDGVAVGVYLNRAA